MRESVGNTWLFSLVVTFIFLFACFLCLAISYSKAFRVKNEIVSITEKYEGVNINSRQVINSYLLSNGYKTMGVCPKSTDSEKWYGEDDLNNTAGTGKDEEYETDGTSKYYYCYQIVENTKTKANDIYYNYIVFYKFTLPVLGDITTFRITGKTINIKEG